MPRKDGRPRTLPNNVPIVPSQSGWMTRNGLIYTPIMLDRQIGYKVHDPERDCTEYILLNPTDDHEINVDNGAIGDTFVYHLDAEGTAEWQSAPDDGTVSIIDFADPVTTVNHFQGTITPNDLDPEAL